MGELDRIRWRCRRGLLELDLLLARFLERDFASLSASELRTFSRLLDCPDPELLDMILGRHGPRSEDERPLLDRLRAC